MLLPFSSDTAVYKRPENVNVTEGIARNNPISKQGHYSHIPKLLQERKEEGYDSFTESLRTHQRL